MFVLPLLRLAFNLAFLSSVFLYGVSVGEVLNGGSLARGEPWQDGLDRMLETLLNFALTQLT